MGKPIAGQNQFPYNTNGFLVDGAKINGVTYAKKLYIYKQRSYSMYDLMDSDGNIFRFIRIGYQNTSNEMLNYFDVDENLVQTIPNNTFFLKIQDPARNIFSFVRIYQWHKCITVEGDYVFRTSDIDPLLSGVLINPVVSTISIGNTLSYETLFFPSNYQDLDGNWYMNSLAGLEYNTNAEIISSNINTAIVKGLSPGQAVLTFVPKRNNALVSHSIINIVQDEQPIQEFSIKTVQPYTYYKTGDEFVLEVVTFPYDAVLTEQLEIDINEGYGNSTTTTLVSVSSDFKKYTFKSILSDLNPPPNEEEEDQRYENVIFDFKMNLPIEYQYSLTDIMICSDYAYTQSYQQPGLLYYPPRGLRPNMTWQCRCEVTGPNQTVYPYVSSDTDIATFDHETGILTTYSKTGQVTFTTQYDKVDGSGLSEYTYAMTLNVREDMYDYITCTPQNIDVVNPGQEFNVTFTGYRDGYDNVNIPVRSSFKPNAYTTTPEGTVTILDNAPVGEKIYIAPEGITLDYQVIATYNSTGIQPTIRNPGNLVPMTNVESNSHSYYIRYSDIENVENWENIIVYTRPNNCSSYQMQFESYDETIVEIIDKDEVTSTQSYAMGGSLYFYVKGINRGSTEMVIRSV